MKDTGYSYLLTFRNLFLFFICWVLSLVIALFGLLNTLAAFYIFILSIINFNRILVDLQPFPPHPYIRQWLELLLNIDYKVLKLLLP